MARRFRGEDTFKVDGKGRVSIPAPFRRVLEASDPEWQPGDNPKLLIFYGPKRQQYLECYTMEAVDDVDARINRLPRGSKERRRLERNFHGRSFPTSVDDTGRLVLPAKLRQQVGIADAAYFIAAGDTFQIWNPETYEEVEEREDEEWLEDQGEDYDMFASLPGDEDM